jgi:hypothetical protein
MAVCSSCGSEASETTNFCTICGQPMAKAAPAPAPAPTPAGQTCQSCGAAVDPSSSFCTSCGRRLPVAAAVTDATPPPVQPDISATVQAVAPAAAPVDRELESAPPPSTSQATPPSDPSSATQAYATQPAHLDPQQPGGGGFRTVILILLVVIIGAAFGGWYFWGVETVVVCSPPNVRVFLDDQEISPVSFGRYVIPHLSRKPHLLKVQSPGFADTVQQLDFPLSSSSEWVNIRLVPSPRLLPGARPLPPTHLHTKQR